MRYFFVDQLIEMIPGKSAVAKKNITASEDCFRDHFPGFPVYPGALLLESMAQIGGILIEKTIRLENKRRVLPILSIVKNAKFRTAVFPGDSLIITVNLENIKQDAAVIEATIKCDDVLKANARIFFTLVDVKRDLDMDTLPEVDMVQDTLVKMNKLREHQKKNELSK